MTKEEAIKVLEAEKKFLFHGSLSDKHYEPAFDMAIEALSDVPDICDGDMISRQDAIDAICTWDKFGVDGRGRIVRWYEGLEPYVHLRDVVTAIVNLPSAEPVQKTGKWIIFPPCIEEICMCSNCKTKFKEAYQHRDTCPSCGAKMEV